MTDATKKTKKLKRNKNMYIVPSCGVVKFNYMVKWRVSGVCHFSQPSHNVTSSCTRLLTTPDSHISVTMEGPGQCIALWSSPGDSNLAVMQKHQITLVECLMLNMEIIPYMLSSIVFLQSDGTELGTCPLHFC